MGDQYTYAITFWMLPQMKIGILGCGYVGTATAKYLKQLDHTVSVTTRKTNRVEELQAYADHIYLIQKDSDYIDFIRNQQILIVSVAPDSPNNYRSTYLETAELIQRHLPQFPHLQQIIYTSSTSVYGDHQGAWVQEDTPLRASNPNQRILIDTEKCLLNCASAHLKVCIYRLGEILGPGRSIENRLKQSIGKTFAGNGNAYTNLIHLDDIVKAINLAVDRQLDGIFNLCNDFHIPRKAWYEGLCQKLNLPPIKWSEDLINPHAGNKQVSNQKMKNLGFFFH